ncbi:probable inactive receptor kinase At5g10020 [Spinacia oleracea]|uniref:Probable inactive receptor kinase At5g10020 n=1 Tax=Spinacia oleracea TaxID=3562 RepID=A0ABM3RHN5_SPIOL|nr:probable inactive receptor kinase At5g10020 [Spinacia oleracea]
MAEDVGVGIKRSVFFFPNLVENDVDEDVLDGKWYLCNDDGFEEDDGDDGVGDLPCSALMFFGCRGNISCSSNGSVVFTIFSLLILIFLTPSLVLCNSDEVRALLEFKSKITHLGKSLQHGMQRLSQLLQISILAPPPSMTSFATMPHVSIILESLNLGSELNFSTLIGLKMLQKLNLRGNNFTGRLVPQLGSMRKMQFLDLSDNQFIGRITNRIHDLWNLQHLNVSNNRFSGGYPVGIQNLQQLRVRDVDHVDLSMNQFSGELPSLEELDLRDNMIGGELSSFGLLINLRVLCLRNNQLYGETPGELLTTSIHLIELDLNGNGFSDNISEHSESSDDDDDDAVELNELPLVENRRLALACDDGYVRLYTIPDTNELTYHKSLPRVSGRDLSVTWSADGNSFIQEVVMGMLFHHAKRICNWSEDVAMLYVQIQ